MSLGIILLIAAAAAIVVIMYRVAQGSRATVQTHGPMPPPFLPTRTRAHPSVPPRVRTRTLRPAAGVVPIMIATAKAKVAGCTGAAER